MLKKELWKNIIAARKTNENSIKVSISKKSSSLS
jgi:hypothetical protein